MPYMFRNRSSLLAIAAVLGGLFASAGVQAADIVLAGKIRSATGETLGGVAVSAKADGQTITTTVYTDTAGAYYFPAMPAGKYKVRAQALTFETAEADVELAAGKPRDFTLQLARDWVRQLPGDELLAALPDATPDDARMKNIIRKTCTGCHTASYPLQHRFDEAGWYAVLEAMKQINVLGTFVPERAHNGTIEHYQHELAAYLARARGPGETSMKFKLRPRPTGEAARVVFREYDVPLDEDLGFPYKYELNDGSDWSKGTPSGLHGGYGIHDAQADLDGNLWFTHSLPSRTITVGRIDAKTGEVKIFKMGEPGGFATNTHGIVRDKAGFLWFNSRPAAARGNRAGLVRIDTKAQELTKYVPPEPMSATAGSLDVDGQGQVWVTTPDGALRFDPKAEKFQEFKSVTYKNGNGTVTVYGLAADAQGNGFWAGMAQDFIDKGDAATGKTQEFKLPPDKREMAFLRPQDQDFYKTYVPVDFNSPFPWAQGPRRMGVDKDAGILWVANSFGGNLARIDTKTLDTSLVPLPLPQSQQPYHVAVDQAHGAWTNLWSTDQVARYNPDTKKWTRFNLPTRGTETRYISLLERTGQPMQVVIPYSRIRKIAVMTVRSDAELAKLKVAARR